MLERPDMKIRWMAVAWPAFVVAAVLEMVVFSVIDPHDMHLFGTTNDWSRTEVYSLAFFLFWVTNFISSGLTAWLLRSQDY